MRQVPPLLLALAWLLAGFSKLYQWPDFVFAIKSFDLVPPAWAPFMAASIPFLEILLGIELCFQKHRREAAGVSMGLLAVFTAILVLALLQGKNLSCGCFGGWLDFGGLHGSIARNFVLIALGVFIIKFPHPCAK